MATKKKRNAAAAKLQPTDRPAAESCVGRGGRGNA
jgi:hypothetical protein